MNVATLSHAPRKESWAHFYVWALFYVMPFADAATGYLVLSGGFAEAAAGSISQLFRATLLIPALLLIKGKATFLALLPVYYVLAFESVMLMLHQHTGWFVVSTVYGFKLVYLVVSYFALRELSSHSRPIDVASYFIHGASIYGVILLLSTLAGLSIPTYGEGTFGSKGLFASGNGLSVYLGCTALLALVRAGADRHSADFWEALFLLMCCLLVGTKASIICALMFAAIFLKQASLVSKLLAIAVTVTGALFFADMIGSLFALVFDVILYRFENSESFFAFMASGRDLYVTEALAGFDLSGWSALRVIFGAGAFVSFRDPGAALTEYDTLESDFFDIFFGYGILGLACYLAVILLGIRLGLRGRQHSLLLVWACICFYSLAAGHVVFNAMSGLSLPMLLIALQRARRPDMRLHA